MKKYSRNVRTKNRSRKRNYISSEVVKHSVKDQKLKKRLYEICFKENSRKLLLMNTSAIAFEIISIVAFIILLLLIVIGGVITYKNIDTPSYYAPLLAGILLVGILSLFSAGITSNFYVKKKYSDFSFFDKNVSINFNTEILFYIRCDKICEFFESEGIIEDNQISYLIEYFTEESESIRKLKWLPFATLSAFLFPFWNVTVSKLFSWNEIHMSILLFVFAIFLSICIWIWRRNIESLIFSKSNNYLYLARVLRTIKSYSKI